MSKATEWAASRRKYGRSPSCRMGPLEFRVIRPTKTLPLRVGVIGSTWRRKPQPVSVRAALACARWLIDTFGEQTA